MIDLHAHTTYSDGTFSPRGLVELAAQVGLSAVAVTDHDSIDGVAEAAAAGGELGVEVVAGVEINLFHDQLTVDLLGYFPGGPPGASRSGGELRTALIELRRARDERNARILERLAGLGYPIAPEELAAIAGGGAVGRPHIGEAMRRRGYVGSITEAFERFLARGAPAWVDRRRLTLSEAVRLVARADGLAVIAHPGIIRTDAASTVSSASIPNTTSRWWRAASSWRPPTTSCRPAARTFTARPNPACGSVKPAAAGPCPTRSSPASRRAGPNGTPPAPRGRPSRSADLAGAAVGLPGGTTSRTASRAG